MVVEKNREVITGLPHGSPWRNQRIDRLCRMLEEETEARLPDERPEHVVQQIRDRLLIEIADAVTRRNSRPHTEGRD